MLTPEEREGFRKKLAKANLEGVEVVADPWSPNEAEHLKLVEELKTPTSKLKPNVPSS